MVAPGGCLAVVAWSGVAADVPPAPVTIVCHPGLFITNLRVDLSQRVAQEPNTSGSGESPSPACTGAEQTIRVRVHAFPGYAFKHGVAQAEASLTVCDEIFSFCDFASTSDEFGFAPSRCCSSDGFHSPDFGVLHTHAPARRRSISVLDGVRKALVPVHPRVLDGLGLDTRARPHAQLV